MVNQIREGEVMRGKKKGNKSGNLHLVPVLSLSMWLWASLNIYILQGLRGKKTILISPTSKFLSVLGSYVNSINRQNWCDNYYYY